MIPCYAAYHYTAEWDLGIKVLNEPVNQKKNKQTKQTAAATTTAITTTTRPRQDTKAL